MSMKDIDYQSDVTLGIHVSDETLTISRMLPSGIKSLPVGSYLRESCQVRNADYCSDVPFGSHASEETLTNSPMLPSCDETLATGRMLSAGIMSVKKP